MTGRNFYEERRLNQKVQNLRNGIPIHERQLHRAVEINNTAIYSLPAKEYFDLQVTDPTSDDYGKFYFCVGYSAVGGPDLIT